MTADEFGSLADETARFLTVLINAVGQPVAVDAEPSPEVCRWCPVCRCAHVLIGTNPQIRAHLTEAVTSLAQAWVLAMAQPARSADGPRRRGGVQHIDLDHDVQEDFGDDGADWDDGDDWPQQWPDEAPQPEQAP